MSKARDSFTNRLKIMLISDEHRVSVQTTAAVLLAFGATLFMGRENMSWGVFSALFVVQATVGGTVSSGLERVAGAVLGAIIGVVAVLLPLNGLAGTLISLLVGVSVMSLVAARWPKRFRYTLALIDRFSDDPPPGLLLNYRDGFYSLCDAVNQQIERLADAIVAHASCEPVPEVTERFDVWCCNLDASLADSTLKQSDRERVIALKEAYAAMLRNLVRLCYRVSEQYAR